MTFSPLIFGSGVGAYNYLQRTRDNQESILRQTGEVSRNIDAVKERMASIQTAEDLLADREVLQVAVSAFGLEEDINNTGFLRQVLESDLNDRRSFANRLADDRYVKLARAFNFAGTTGANLPGSSAADTLSPRLQALGSPEDLFNAANATLFDQALSAFGLEADKSRTEFLKTVLKSDLDDPRSLVNRLGDQRYVDFVAAFSGKEDRLPPELKGKLSDAVANRLRQVTEPSELVSDTRLLRSVLTQFGLEDSAANTFFIQSVLESDLSDPKSLANTVSDTRFRDLARTFDFQGRSSEADSLHGFAVLAKSKPNSLTSADAFLADEKLLAVGLKLFGLENEASNKTYLKSVLESDLTDNNSTANQQTDDRYAAFSAAFGFGAKISNPSSTTETRLEKLIAAADNRSRPVEDATEFFSDASFFLAATNFFDLPQGSDETAYTRRVLFSDPDSPTSSYSVATDQKYRLLADSLNFQEEKADHAYPPGFVDAIVDEYVSRQFEIAVGNVDNSMRLSLSLDRSLNEIVDGNSSNNGRWFAAMGALPVRAVLEGAFNLPSAFGSLDIDQQLDIFKQRAESQLGTANVEDFLKPEIFEEIQRKYLVNQSLNLTASIPAASILLSS